MATRTAASAGRLTRKAVGPFPLHAPCSLSAVKTRRCSTNLATQREKKPKRSPVRPAVSTTHDWIGPPNPLSNLRPIVYRVPENESELEKRLRHLRQETEDWNHDFWTEQNIRFSKEKENFIFSQLKAKGLPMRDERGHRHTLDSETMAVFYKSFLDTNRIRHADYNRQWYRRNFTITFLMAQVALKNMWKTLTDRHSSTR